MQGGGCEPAPISAYVPESATYPGNSKFNQWPIRRPSAAPERNVGTKSPAGAMTPDVMDAMKKYGRKNSMRGPVVKELFPSPGQTNTKRKRCLELFVWLT